MEEPCHVMRSRSRHLRWLRPWRRLPRRPPGTQLRRCSRRPPIHPAASQTQSSERAFFCVPMAIPFLSGHSMIDLTSFVSSLSLSNNYAAAYADSLQDWLKGVCVRACLIMWFCCLTFGKMRSPRFGVEIMSTCSLPSTSWQLLLSPPSSLSM